MHRINLLLQKVGTGLREEMVTTKQKKNETEQNQNSVPFFQYVAIYCDDACANGLGCLHCQVFFFCSIEVLSFGPTTFPCNKSTIIVIAKIF